MIGGHQFQRAKLAKFVEEPTAETILAAFSARESEELGFDAMAASFESEHAAIFVIRMSDNLHQSSGGAELANLKLQSVDA